MLKIESGFDGELGESDRERIAKLSRKYGFLAAAIGISEDELASISMSSRLAAHVGTQTRLDMSPFSPLVRMRFAKEFSRLFDAVHGTGGPTSNWSMSILFEGLDYGGREPYPDDSTTIIRKTADGIFSQFVGSRVEIEVRQFEVVGGMIDRMGGTGEFVDRRSYYEGLYEGNYYEDFDFELKYKPDGPMIVREHTADLQVGLRSRTIDLDQVTGIKVVS